MIALGDHAAMLNQFVSGYGPLLFLAISGIKYW